jgi:hypothetical protein
MRRNAFGDLVLRFRSPFRTVGTRCKSLRDSRLRGGLWRLRRESGACRSPIQRLTEARLLWIGVLAVGMFALLGFSALNGVTVGGWTDDVVYLASGIELWEGRGYRVPMFPGAPLLGKYPPLFPIALGAAAQVLPALPEGLFWFKAFVFGLALPAVLLFALWLRDGAQVRAVPLPLRFSLVAFVAVQGLMLMFDIELMSEALFGSLLGLGVWLVDRPVEHAPAPRAIALAIIMSVLLFYTRTIGIVFWFTLLLYALLHRHWRAALAVGVAGLTMVPWFWWSGHFVPEHEPMIGVLPYYLSYDWHGLALREYLWQGSGALAERAWHLAAGNASSLVKAIGAVMLPSVNFDDAGAVLTAPRLSAWLVSGAVLIGLGIELRHKGFAAILLCAYLAFACGWPWLNKLRFVAVVAPWVAYFAVRAMSLGRGPWRAWFQSGVILLCMASNLAFWFSRTFLPGDLATRMAKSPGAAQRADDALLRSAAWIRRHVPPDAVLVSDLAAPFFYVHTGRTVLPLHTVQQTPGQHLAAMLSNRSPPSDAKGLDALTRSVQALTGHRVFFEVHVCERACPARDAGGSVPGWQADFRGDPGSEAAILIRRHPPTGSVR